MKLDEMDTATADLVEELSGCLFALRVAVERGDQALREDAVAELQAVLAGLSAGE